VVVLAGVAVGAVVGAAVGGDGGTGVGGGGGVGWQAVAQSSSAKRSRAARTVAYALSRFRKDAMRW
jgi:hypothetical protein